MRLLALSDFHYDPIKWITEQKFLYLEEFAKKEKVDSVILCGDNSQMWYGQEYHHRFFSRIMKIFPCPVGFVCGNHDLWARGFNFSSRELLEDKFPEIAKSHDMKYLEHEDIEIGDWKIIGTYGHYDCSLTQLDKIVTQDAIQKGRLEYSDKVNEYEIVYNDVEQMKWKGEKDKEICRKLIARLEERLSSIDEKKRIITISHTLPSKRSTGKDYSIKQNFIRAFSGSTKLGDILKKFPVNYHFCGHSHAPFQGKIGNAMVVNVGSDYHTLRFVLLDTDSGKITRFQQEKYYH